MFISLIFIAVEVREFIDDGWRSYIGDFQNYLHLWGALGMWVPVFHMVMYSSVRKEVDSITIIFNWLNMLGYLKGFKLTGKKF